MQTQAIDQLDAEELYHLALKASEKGDHDEAILMLKKSLELKPDAKTQYILAAEHAEIGMLERAAIEMQKATELDNSLHTAFFQLGLLHMMLQRPEEAITAWGNLLDLDENDHLFLFASGMTHLLQDKLEPSANLLEQGLEKNTANPALNKDIQSILKNIRQTMELDLPISSDESSAEKSKPEAIETKKKANPLFLASYDNKEEH